MRSLHRYILVIFLMAILAMAGDGLFAIIFAFFITGFLPIFVIACSVTL